MDADHMEKLIFYHTIFKPNTIFRLSSLYKGNKFDGYCEVINAMMAVISILATC